MGGNFFIQKMKHIGLSEVTIGMPFFNDVVFIYEYIVLILNQTSALS